MTFFPCLFRCELQISQSPGQPCGPRSPPLPVHHPPPAGRAHCHDANVHHVLPACSSASGQRSSYVFIFKTTVYFKKKQRVFIFETRATAVTMQVGILLYVASLMVRWLWRRGLDPDNFSIPYLTALGDLLGTGFLALSFRLIVMISSTQTGV